MLLRRSGGGLGCDRKSKSSLLVGRSGCNEMAATAAATAAVLVCGLAE